MFFDERSARISRRGSASLGAGLLAAASLSPARAAEPARGSGTTDFLIWQAPVGCATAAAVRERVHELLGEPELDLRHVQRVEGRVTELARGWRLHLTLVDAHGQRERTLESEQCQDLAEAAAVAITLAFEAARAEVDAGGAEAHGSVAETNAVPPEPVTPDAAPANEPPASEAREDAASDDADAAEAAAEATAASAALGAELLVDVNSLPSVSLGLSLFGALRWSELRLALFAAWLPEAEEAVAPDQSVSFTLLSGGLRACYGIGHGLVDTSLCAGAELGRLAASGSGLFQSRDVSDLWLAPQLGLELGAPLGSSLSLRARADALFPLLRQSYAVNETEDVHATPAVAVRASAGVWLAF